MEPQYLNKAVITPYAPLATKNRYGNRYRGRVIYETLSRVIVRFGTNGTLHFAKEQVKILS